MYDWSEISLAYEQGATFRALRERYGMSLGALSKAVARGDIRPRSKGKYVAALDYAAKHHGERDRYGSIRKKMRAKIIKEGLIDYKCGICGIREWRGQPLTLSLDHESGDGRDQRLENLRFLCPNCDSQQPTYGNRNRGRYKNPMVIEAKAVEAPPCEGG